LGVARDEPHVADCQNEKWVLIIYTTSNLQRATCRSIKARIREST
jgi:hypothetical protein